MSGYGPVSDRLEVESDRNVLSTWRVALDGKDRGSWPREVEDGVGEDQKVSSERVGWAKSMRMAAAAVDVELARAD